MFSKPVLWNGSGIKFVGWYCKILSTSLQEGFSGYTRIWIAYIGLYGLHLDRNSDLPK